MDFERKNETEWPNHTLLAYTLPADGQGEGERGRVWEREDERMTKRKRKLTPAEKGEKRRRRELYETVFVGGKQKRIKRAPTVEGLPVDEFIRRNADPVWLHQNAMWETMDQEEEDGPQQHIS